MSQLIDPNDFIITRKRKKYKFAKFANATNCFELDDWRARSVDVVEIGAGTGLFSVELALRHPEKVFVALDVKADRLQKGAYTAIERGLDNIFFIRARADQVEKLLLPHSVAQVWVTFADPFPRKGSAGRRMTHPSFLRSYANLLRPNGSLLIKHDSPDFFAWTLEQLVAENWRIDELAFDLHESGLNDDYKIQTTYEARWLEQGRQTSFLRANPPA